MTKRKALPPHNYDTFPEDAPQDEPPQHRSDSDKSRSAAEEARRLGSQGSWADSFATASPAAVRTPAASSAGDFDDDRQDVRYPLPPHTQYHSEPPPVYTPS